MSESPFALAVKLNYQKLDIQDKWNEKRVKRLCGYLRIDELELCTLLGMREETFLNQMAKRRITMPACILLTMLEDFLTVSYTHLTLPTNSRV